MPGPRSSLATLALVLAVLTILAVGLSHLALVDIGHGEGDVLIEWTILRVAAVIEVSLALATLALVRQVWAHGARPPQDNEPF